VVIRLSPARRATIQRITFPLLVLLSAVMIVLGKADKIVLESLRSSVIDAAAPMLDAFSRPAHLFDAAVSRARGLVVVYQQNERLAEENERLLRWQQAALKLASENAQLRDLLRVSPDPATSYTTARVIASSGGAYARSVIVNAGRENGVMRGQAAITGEGLVGRVSEAGDRAARVLLITDLNSRVPVIAEGSRQRAVLAGDNSERPSLRYVAAGAAMRIGDRIVTSGQGGVFPPGLPVGVVAAFDGELARVEPFAALSQVEYLRIVDYGLADALPDPLPFGPRSGRRAEQAAGGQPAWR
jgi:rod shape-determining protein MreC